MQLKCLSNIDSSYQTFAKPLVKEMYLYLELPNVSKTIKKQFKSHKPFLV